MKYIDVDFKSNDEIIVTEIFENLYGNHKLPTSDSKSYAFAEYNGVLVPSFDGKVSEVFNNISKFRNLFFLPKPLKLYRITKNKYFTFSEVKRIPNHEKKLSTETYYIVTGELKFDLDQAKTLCGKVNAQEYYRNLLKRKIEFVIGNNLDSFINKYVKAVENKEYTNNVSGINSYMTDFQFSFKMMEKLKEDSYFYQYADVIGLDVRFYETSEEELKNRELEKIIFEESLRGK